MSVLEGGYRIQGGIVSAFGRSVAGHVRALVDGCESRQVSIEALLFLFFLVVVLYGDKSWRPPARGCYVDNAVRRGEHRSASSRVFFRLEAFAGRAVVYCTVAMLRHSLGSCGVASIACAMRSVKLSRRAVVLQRGLALLILVFIGLEYGSSVSAPCATKYADLNLDVL